MMSERTLIYLQALLQQSDLNLEQIAQVTMCPVVYLRHMLAGQPVNHPSHNLAIALLYCQTFHCEIPVMAA